MDAALRVAEKAPVGALEPGGAVARRMDDEARPTIGPLAAGAGSRKGRHQERASGALSPDLALMDPFLAPSTPRRASPAGPCRPCPIELDDLRFHISSPVPFP